MSSCGIQPYASGDGWTLYHGDARAEFPPLIGASWPEGLRPRCGIITDPPYGISHSSNHGASWMGTTIASDHDTSARDAVLDVARTVGAPWASFGTWKTPPPANARACLVWDKGPAFGMGDLSLPWKPSWELIYVGGDGWTGSRDEGVLRGHIVVSWESKGRVHPHEKPVSLIRALLGKLPDDFTFVVDPFCGSGTTGVACRQTGRHFIGIELDEGYCELAASRIASALNPQTYRDDRAGDAPLFKESA